MFKNYPALFAQLIIRENNNMGVIGINRIDLDAHRSKIGRVLDVVVVVRARSC